MFKRLFDENKMEMSEETDVTNLWKNFQKIRIDNRDASANIMWFTRKRDEAMNPQDYLYYNHQVCKFVREQSDLQIQETSLFLELQKMYPEYK